MIDVRGVVRERITGNVLSGAPAVCEAAPFQVGLVAHTGVGARRIEAKEGDGDVRRTHLALKAVAAAAAEDCAHTRIASKQNGDPRWSGSPRTELIRTPRTTFALRARSTASFNNIEFLMMHWKNISAMGTAVSKAACSAPLSEIKTGFMRRPRPNLVWRRWVVTAAALGCYR
jgi:hypothetical protein